MKSRQPFALRAKEAGPDKRKEERRPSPFDKKGCPKGDSARAKRAPIWYFIDTNIFLRVLVKENEKIFKDCQQFLNLIRQNKVKAFTSTIVLSEIDWVLESFYKFPKKEVIKGLSSILKLKNLKFFDKFNLLLAIELYKKFPVKFIDALIASSPRIFKKETTIISYDEDFDKLDVRRKEPKEALKKI